MHDDTPHVVAGRVAPEATATTSNPTTLLIGTALSVRQLYHCLAVAQPRPRIVGCLLPAGVEEQGAGVGGQGAGISAALCPVLGCWEDLSDLLAAAEPALLPFEQVLISLPLALAATERRMADTLDRHGVTWRFLPTLGDQLAGRTTSRITGGLAAGPVGSAGSGGSGGSGGPGAGSAMTAGSPIDPAQLINRKPQPLDEATIRRCLHRRRVLITGAGGSIGAELARIVSRFEPAMLLLLERSENALFEIDRELARIFPSLERKAMLHDVTQRDATLALIKHARPDVIFHAAAHKHVPMMEDHPAAAMENNFFGTRHMADAANECGVDRFVMISTDKAVNPSSVMGASKRLAELYIQHLNTQSDTTFCMVRFGNVLGSACSVLPIWMGQLAHGGPITVTHPQMTRYFMTIPEAAGLVLQAGALSQGGEVFLLDMGQPVRIVDLARRFLLQQGFEPEVDVRIQFTGIRPGEKLFEELAYDGEDMQPTTHAAIRTWRTTPPDAAQMRQIVNTFEALRRSSHANASPWQHTSRQAIVTALRSAIPEMVTAAAS